MGLFLVVLLAGMAFFLWEYSAHGGEWVIFPGSPHVYNGTNIGCGTVGIPMRLGATPEITVITLRRAPEHSQQQ